MGRPLCGVMSAEGKMITAFVRDTKQADDFAKLLWAPEKLIKDFCRENGIVCKEGMSMDKSDTVDGIKTNGNKS